MKWRGEVHLWPYSTGRGQAVDQRDAGDRIQVIEIVAADFDEALKLVRQFREGLSRNPAVWQAPIMSLVRVP